MCKIWKIPNVCFLVADCCSVVARDKSRTVVTDIFLHCVVCVCRERGGVSLCVCVLLSVRLRVLGELAPRAHTHTHTLGAVGGREGEGIFNLGKRGVPLQTRSFSCEALLCQSQLRTS